MHSNLLLRKPTDSKLYVEDVFSTYLYDGVGLSSQTITNGIDLTGKGGMVWVKARNDGALSSVVFDTARGNNKVLATAQTGAEATLSSWSPNTNETFVFGSSGFTVSKGSNVYSGGYVTGTTSNTYASWTFRKAPKFFDVVTYTGDGATNRQISHSLGATPGMLIVKCTSTSASWVVWHRSLGGTNYNMYLNGTFANAANGDLSPNGLGTITSTSFCVSADYGLTNTNGASYVAYLFAHDTTADGVIQCGSMTTDATSVSSVVNLGWEPQYILLKRSDGTQNWLVFDTMRGMSLSSTADLYPNLSNAENLVTPQRITLTPTGFQIAGTLSASATYIYLAIRRGPMRVPTDATKVFNPIIYSGSSSNNRVVSTTNQPDAVWWASRNGVSYTNKYVFDRLRGVSNSGGTGSGGYLTFETGDAEYPNASYQISALNNQSVTFGSASVNGFDQSGLSASMLSFTRAPGFFDIVGYSGTGSTAPSKTHSLGVVPDMIFAKKRSSAGNWFIFHRPSGLRYSFYLNSQGPIDYGAASNIWNPTSTTFDAPGSLGLDNSGSTYVAYLFASVPGVSKVGTYTGTGSTTQNVDCGFTNGARFVLIKANAAAGTTADGGWAMFDTARGINVGNDPTLWLNYTYSEYNTWNQISPFSGGFKVEADNGNSGLNASGVQYIYLAIA